MNVVSNLHVTAEHMSEIVQLISEFLCVGQAFSWEEHHKIFDRQGNIRDYQMKVRANAHDFQVCPARTWLSVRGELPEEDDLALPPTCGALIPATNMAKKIKSQISVTGDQLTLQVFEIYKKGGHKVTLIKVHRRPSHH